MSISQLLSLGKFRAKAFRQTRRGITSVRLDASTVCQLRCPICPTADGSNRSGVVGHGFLKFDDFRSFLERHPLIRKIELSNWGEIFLNPDIRKIIGYACEKNVELTASNGSNLNTADEGVLEDLVRFGFRFLSISIDGATAETYGKYRRGGNLEQVLSNIRRINAYKEQYNSPYPKLRWQFVVFGHNEGEIAEARRLAAGLGMEFYPKLNYDQGYSPVLDPARVKEATGLKYASRDEFRQKKQKEYAFPCKQLWFSPQINWDGKLLGCCVNRYSDFGNVFDRGLDACMKAEKYEYTKRMLLGRAAARDDIPCIRCDVFRSAGGALWKMF